jgi:type I restriction enzyme S subunit
MSRGRKSKTISTGSIWEQIFNKSQGFYFQYIITQLARKNKKLSEYGGDNLLEEIKQEKERLVAKKKISKEKPFTIIKDEEILFEIPSNWTWCRLGEIVQHNSGKTLDSGRNKGNLTEYITTSNLYWGYFKLDNLKQMPMEDEELKRCLAVKGDLLICEGGEAGRAAVWESENSVCFQNHIHRVRPYLNINSHYLYHFFQYLNFSGEINNYRKGMGISNLSGKSLSSIIVPLPPLSEQKMIVDFLQDFGKNVLDENREYFDYEIENEVVSIHQAQIYNNQISTELNHQLALVKELRQAYLREAMQGKLVPQDSTDEPAEILLEKIKAEKEKLVAEKRIRRDKPLPPINPEEIPFEIPSNWTWCRLGEISNNVEYGTSEKGDLNSNDIAVLRMNNIQSGKVVLENLKYVKATIEDLPRLYLKNNDLLFNRTNSYELVGKAGVFKGESDKLTFASYLIRVQFSDLVSVDFANYYINSIQCRETQIEPDIIQQNGQANFNGTKLKNIIVPLPPLAEQERIVAKLEKLMRFCDELEANIRQGIKNADQLLQTALKEALEPK